MAGPISQRIMWYPGYATATSGHRNASGKCWWNPAGDISTTRVTWCGTPHTRRINTYMSVLAPPRLCATMRRS